MSEGVLVKCVVQRAVQAQVVVDGVSRGLLDRGLVVLFGVGFQHLQSAESHLCALNSLEIYTPMLEKLADKLLNLRIFEDSHGKMNLSVKDALGGIYVISQFTLFADCKKGNRPSFMMAASPEVAESIYNFFVKILQKKSESISILTGVFAADMKVSFCNDGPVTLVLEAGLKGIL